MKINYFRERKEHHMVIAAGINKCPDYQVRMLQRNPVEGLLFPVIRQMDGEILYDYSITGCHSLQTLTELAPISRKLLVSIVEDMNRILEDVERYLVDGDYLALRPEFIYLEKQGENTYKTKFCFFPFHGEEPETQVRELLKYVLNEVDYQEKDAVNLAYELFQTSSEEGFLIRQLGGLAKMMIQEENPTTTYLEDRIPAVRAVRECGEYGVTPKEMNVGYEIGSHLSTKPKKKLLGGRSGRKGREIILSEILK